MNSYRRLTVSSDKTKTLTICPSLILPTSIHSSRLLRHTCSQFTKVVSSSATLTFPTYPRPRAQRLKPLVPLVNAITPVVLNSLLPPALPQPRRLPLLLPTAPSSTAPNPYQQDGKTIYNRATRALPGPVLHNANVYFQHTPNGNPKRYLAVASVHDICSKCFPTEQFCPDLPHAASPCTSRQCTRCNYYGHNAPWCLQTHTTSGVPVPQIHFCSRLRGVQELTPVSS
jgi:hypothetical protein